MERLSTGTMTSQLSRLGLSLAILFCGVFGLSATAHSETLVQGFKAKGDLAPGWVVAISSSGSDTVEAAPSNNPDRIFGVVIDPSDAPATLNRQGQQVFVATSGDFPILVSDQNGQIKAGDYLSLSTTNGIAAKATNQQSFIIGRALENFDGQTNAITSGSGSAIGRVRANIAPQRSPLLKNDVLIPGPLRRLGDSIAGRSVSALRIYAAGAIFLISALIATSLILVGVRSGMAAIGRNPLSRHSILGSLSQVVVVATVVFIVGLFGVYLLLRL